MTSMPPGVADIYEPLWSDVRMLGAKILLADSWFWDDDALEVLRWGVGPAILVVRDSLSHDLVVSVQRLFDPARQSGHDNLSLAQLVDAVRCASPVAASALDRELQSLRLRHDAITVWRNKRSAHRDLNTALGVDPLAGLTAAAMRTAVSDIGEFMNRVAGVFGDPPTEWGVRWGPPFGALVDRLRSDGGGPPQEVN